MLRFKPTAQAQHADAVSSESAPTLEVAKSDVAGGESPGTAEPAVTAAAQQAPALATTSGGLSWLVILYVAMTAVCWGTYGPLLHRGQAAMSSRMRPFICVGISYFVVAIIFPLFLLSGSNEPLSFPMVGTLWSLLAGTAGAIGALGVILAFNSGGRPVVVMPLVFGGAPIVNTLISLLRSRIHGEPLGTLSPWFIGSLLLVILGSATVLIFVPKAPHAKPPESSSQRDDEAIAEPAPAS